MESVVSHHDPNTNNQKNETAEKQPSSNYNLLFTLLKDTVIHFGQRKLNAQE